MTKTNLIQLNINFYIQVILQSSSDGHEIKAFLGESFEEGAFSVTLLQFCELLIHKKTYFVLNLFSNL